MSQHTVHFEVHPNGNIDYIPGLLHANKGHQVKWTCNVDDFFVAFVNTPFPDHTYAGTAGDTGFKTIKTSAAPGNYHYLFGAIVTTRVRGKKVKKLVMTVSCPEIDIP